MTIGFKTGPKNWQEGKDLVLNEGAAMCEIWLDITHADEYGQHLKWFQKHNVQLGLHHWGICRNNIKNNLATHHQEIRNETIQQIKKTIDLGSSIDCSYVNIHPGATSIEHVTLTPWTSSIAKDFAATPQKVSDRLMLEAAELLNDYAVSRHVTLLVETLCGAECLTGEDRSAVFRPGNASLELMHRIAAKTFIANDLTHTVTSPDYEGRIPAREEMWQILWNFSSATHTATKLIHINTLTPPFNGTDSHDGILDDDFSLPVFPSREQIKKILHLYQESALLYIVPEPRTNMTANYRALLQLVSEL